VTKEKDERTADYEKLAELVREKQETELALRNLDKRIKQVQENSGS